jgi:hypothetical protein
MTDAPTEVLAVPLPKIGYAALDPPKEIADALDRVLGEFGLQKLL